MSSAGKAIAEVLGQARSVQLVGREAEWAQLLAAASSTTSTVIFLYGAGGTGKSTLLRSLDARMRADGRIIVAIDLARIAAEPSALETAARAALDSAAPLVLTLDSVERFDALSEWLLDSPLTRLKSGNRGARYSHHCPDLECRPCLRLA